MGFYRHSPTALGRLTFSGDSSDYVLVLYVSMCLSCIQVLSGSSFSGTPWSSKSSASLNFSDTEPATQLLHTSKALLYTMSFTSSFDSNIWIWQQRSGMFCKITYRTDTVYLQGKQCYLWSKYRQANCVWRHLHPASSTPQKLFRALFSNFNHFCCFGYSAWKTAISGILLLNTLLTLFKCSIWKVHLSE